MSTLTNKALISVFMFAAASLFLLPTKVWSQEVQLQHNGQTLNAKLNVNPADLSGRRVFLILHGTLGHNSMEIIDGLLAILQEEDEAAMAMTLSLGIDDRRGMFDCNVRHNHQHEDAKLEIEKWLNWLTAKGATDVVLVGHSRGSIQVADYLLDYEQNLVSSAVLIAPPSATKQLPKNKIKTVLRKYPIETSAGKYHSVDQFLHCGASEVSTASLHSYYGDRPNNQTFQTLSKISLPIMMILGSKDKVSNPKLWKQQKGLDKTVHLKVISGADHFFRDLYLYEIAEQVIEWLE